MLMGPGAADKVGETSSWIKGSSLLEKPFSTIRNENEGKELRR